jgi:DNA modification methylase
MSILLHGDCLEEMKGIDNDSVDFIFCDLPYGQTSCKWDCKIDLQKFWIEIMRIKKINTPIFMTTTTKFGVELIQSAPKKCPFRYDIVWVKSSPAGFLSAKKMPMRKHEMVYVFYEKLPFYDLSSHTHKFIKETVNKRNGKDGVDNKGMIKNRSKTEIQNKYTPPLPVSVIKEEKTQLSKPKEKDLYGGMKGGTIGAVHGVNYDPPLPVSVVKEDIRKDKHKTAYGDNIHYHNNQQRNGESIYEPPLPTSMLEIKSTRGKHSTEKPVALIEWLLKYYSKEGNTVLDPTMGSGSTGVACKNMNRNFIGIEKDPEIYEVAVNRIED